MYINYTYNIIVILTMCTLIRSIPWKTQRSFILYNKIHQEYEHVLILCKAVL